MLRQADANGSLHSPAEPCQLACDMYAVAPIMLGGKQFLVGQFNEFFFRGFPIRQPMNASDADGDYSMWRVAVWYVEGTHPFAYPLCMLTQVFDIGRE